LIILRERLIELYRRELNAKVKERLLLVIRVIVDGELPAHAVKEIHRSKPWGSYWLERYDKEGIEGLRDKPRSGRIPQISLSVSTRIRKTLRESRHGWTTRQANDLIVNESGIIHYHYTHVYRLLHRWGFKQKVPRKVHVNTASNEEKEEFKKEQRWF
jgi:putative transposase